MKNTNGKTIALVALVVDGIFLLIKYLIKRIVIKHKEKKGS